MKTYKAPWSRSLVVISVIAVVVVIGLAAALLVRDPHAFSGWLLLALLVAATLFVIRRYTIAGDTVCVRRLLWSTRVPVRHLQAVRAEPDAMRGSLRLFGNGGLFSFTGIYRNGTLGRYRAYVTDPHRTVVLRFPAHTVVLSPDDPEAFAKELDATRAGLAQSN